ncbi:MAG: hypothetical protein RLZZ546_2644 [Bacteroidota bacterium]
MRVLVYGQLVKKEDANEWKMTVDELLKNEFAVYIFEEILSQYHTLVGFNENINTFNLVSDIDLILTLGGDGTMIKASTIACKKDIPLVGINLGRLGFLSSVEKSKIKSAIDKIKRKKFTIEKRAMLSLECNLPLFDNEDSALNDITIHKRDTSSMMTIHTYIDGTYLNTYWADGLIIATPTGSTGYSLACGGPIIFPGSGNFVITPIAPHSLNVRPLVIQDDVKISFEIEGRAENYLCTLDSRYEIITEEYKISVKKSKFNTKLLTLEGLNFMGTIRDKLLWGLDKRN